MPNRTGGSPVEPAQVFLNVPYNKSYERILVALTSALVALGRVPRLTFQVPEVGEGRRSRIFQLLKSCPVSIHDLSSVGMPVRFNMPFELGLACALREQTRRHEFLVLEKRPHRLEKHLSDLNGIDPKIHGGTVRGAICAVLDVLKKPDGNPSADEVIRLDRVLMKLVPVLKKRHRTDELFNPRIYGELVALGTRQC
jgi:hypothetical protein